MATKAQLEAELADLKRQLAQRDTPTDDTPDTGTLKAAPAGGGLATDGSPGIEEDAGAQEWEAQIQDVLKELEDLPQKKPLLFALGVFALGYMFGRSR